jgi:hypothetical protein
MFWAADPAIRLYSSATAAYLAVSCGVPLLSGLLVLQMLLISKSFFEGHAQGTAAGNVHRGGTERCTYIAECPTRPLR